MSTFTALVESVFPVQTSSNSTSSGLSSAVLETFVPGYSIFRKLALQILGFDISILVPVFGLLFLLRSGYRSVGKSIIELIQDRCTCSISVTKRELDAYASLMKWLVVGRRLTQTRTLRVAGLWWRKAMDSPEALLMEKTSQAQADSVIFNYQALRARQPLGFEPNFGTYSFWHRGRRFQLRIHQEPPNFQDDAVLTLTISTYGFSVEPIKHILEDARMANSSFKRSTAFWRGDNAWRLSSSRSTRAISTVALDLQQKSALVQDLNAFVNPLTQQWYSSRGIPYRRGYLLSGPPGTGKTSMSIALAGLFGLDVYGVSLQNAGMTESRLLKLFDELPDRCLVLLEDIDSAGIDRETGSSLTASGPFNTLSTTGASKNASKTTSGLASGGISLAGLLNVIDGASSHEGHVLIMTTNRPEQLDDALRRPGRVDLHVEFSLATKFQAREIYLRMYTEDATSSTLPSPTKRRISADTVEDVCCDWSEQAVTYSCRFMSMTAIEAAADSFVEFLPEKILSPAEIQGYLLVHRLDPQGAVEQFKTWIEETLRLKAEKGLRKTMVNGVDGAHEDKQLNEA